MLNTFELDNVFGMKVSKAKLLLAYCGLRSGGPTGEDSFDCERGRGASGGIVYKITAAFRSFPLS